MELIGAAARHYVYEYSASATKFGWGHASLDPKLGYGINWHRDGKPVSSGLKVVHSVNLIILNSEVEPHF